MRANDQSMMTRLWRVVRRALLAIVAFALLFPPLYNFLVPEPRAAPIALPLPGARQLRCVRRRLGYHTSIIVQQPSGWSLGPPGRERAPFLEYAWGDRIFYMESNYQPQAVFATLVLPTPTVVVLSTAERIRPDFAARARCMRARWNASTTRALLLELEGTFRRSAGMRLEPYPIVAFLHGTLLSVLRPILLDSRLQLVDGRATLHRSARRRCNRRHIFRAGEPPIARLSSYLFRLPDPGTGPLGHAVMADARRLLRVDLFPETRTLRRLARRRRHMVACERSVEQHRESHSCTSMAVRACGSWASPAGAPWRVIATPNSPSAGRLR